MASSNNQRGTRNMSAGDWIRLKRIRGSALLPNSTFQIQPIVGIPPNNENSNTFVLACIDPRFTAALEDYLLNTLVGSYDLFVLAGSALGGNLTGHGSGIGLCSVVSTGNNWQTALLEHIQVAITLHDVQQILIVDHLDCGAYGACGGTDTSTGHNAQFTTLLGLIDAHTFYTNAGSTATGSAIFGSNIFGYYFDHPSGSTTALTTYTGNVVSTQHFPNTSGASVLVLGCIDPRFLEMMSWFLLNYKEVKFNYDLFILAGSSLGANQSYTSYPTLRASTSKGSYPGGIQLDGTHYLGVNWGPTLFDHIAVAKQLHQITEVWVFDHLDCGAYKAIQNIPTDLDIGLHTTELRKLQGFIGTPHSDLSFKGFVMDTNGLIVNVVDDGKGIDVPLRTFGSSRIRNPSSDITDQKAFQASDYTTQVGKSIVGTRLCDCSTFDPIKHNPLATLCTYQKGGS